MTTHSSEVAIVRLPPRQIAAAVIRSLLSATSMVVVYYQAPLNRSITAWLVANPDLLLATNFGVPESVFASMPTRALIIPKRG